MGGHRFRLTNMLPNSWFHKLKEKKKPASTTTSTPRTTTRSHTPTSPNLSIPPPSPQNLPINHGRPSYYIPSNDEHRHLDSPLHPKASDTKFLIDPSRKTKKKPNKIHGHRPPPPKPIVRSALHRDLDLEPAAIFDLPPILTRPKRREDSPRDPRSPRKRSSVGTHGIKVRAISPRLAGKRAAQPCRSVRKVGTRKGLAGSFPVVKSSADPQKDFRESMLEMIVENKIRAVEEMEDLLACYLSLNSKEYHDVIVEVFEQIWFELTSIRS